jgi:uncharacterized protein involved in exopolysaccharide biosynthesis
MENNHQYIEKDEVSLKELIGLIQSYLLETLRFWWLIGIFAILIAAYFAYKAYKTPKLYKASVTYTTSDGSGLGGLAGGLLGRFVGGGTGSPLKKMEAMISSRQIMQNVLLEKAEIDGKTDFLINHQFEIYGFKDDEDNLFAIETQELKTTKDRRRLKVAKGHIINELLTTDVKEETGIATITISSISEEYSYELSKRLYKELENFYIESEIGEQKKTLEILEYRADSLYNVINGKAITVAQLQDKDKGRFRATDLLPETRAQTEFEALTGLYTQVLQNLETVRFTVASSTPTIKIIDNPMLPITGKKPKILIRAIIGGVVGGFLGIIFVVGRKILLDALRDEETA